MLCCSCRPNYDAATKEERLRALKPHIVRIYFLGSRLDLAQVAGQFTQNLRSYGLATVEVSPRDEDFMTRVGAKGFEIRYDSGKERDAAEHLLRILKLTEPNYSFRMQVLPDGSSPNMISVVLGS